MQEFLIVLTIFGSVAFVIKILSDNRVRTRIIENTNINDQEKMALLQTGQPGGQTLQSIKWGLVLIAIGLALLIGNIFPYQVSEEMTFGFGFLFAGLAFLAYYILAKRMAGDQELPG